MTDHDPAADDRLFEELKEALAEADAVPDDVLAAAKASFTWRTIDAELAQLEFDSAVAEVSGVRGSSSERQLMYRTAQVEIEVTVHGTETRHLAGQLIPPRAANVELLAQGMSRSTMADESGAFEFADVPAGPVSIRCDFEDGTAITTEWTLL